MADWAWARWMAEAIRMKHYRQVEQRIREEWAKAKKMKSIEGERMAKGGRGVR